MSETRREREWECFCGRRGRAGSLTEARDQHNWRRPVDGRSARRTAPMAAETLERIDRAIRLNYMLIADGPHPAVDGKAVRRKIDELLDARRTLIQQRRKEEGA